MKETRFLKETGFLRVWRETGFLRVWRETGFLAYSQLPIKTNAAQ
ncbi:hypothetical protein [Arthrospira platensis]|nr:hypothetical protein [Arthrospira platensis]MDF2211507.1 hypothetical protein [Arthrospira platensis NCB002]MDT9181906.1 hypothetical protein [Limnospira sp. PMC 289.06]MDT9296273.1 hypothetical protein [Arthrospira platensis PCC 7345]MDT9309745.1 hypothetical protein [Limnospira sp. Paracas R14]WAK74231.1 hypothetical protein AP9108_32910 [Arthrospira sp. PCC 9108]